MKDKFLPNWIKINRTWTIDSPIEYRDWALVKIYRETARKLFAVATVEIRLETDNTPIPQIVNQKLLSFFKKRTSTEFNYFLQEIASFAVKFGSDPEIFINNLIAAGYLAKWNRLAKDGVSVVSTQIGPSRLLEKEIQSQREANKDRTMQWVSEQKDRLTLLKKNSLSILMEIQQSGVVRILDQVDYALVKLDDYLLGYGEQPVLSQGHTFTRFSANKFPNGFTLGIEFLLSLCNVIFSNKEGFEWKEIGATSYEEIGGSKRFDSSKEILIKLAETISINALSDMGLLSRGSLYPIYLAGNYRILYSDGSEENRLRMGLYSITNVQVEEIKGIDFPGKVVICTENRALLLKMYKSGWLDNSNALIVGIDGQVKNAHRVFLSILSRGKFKFFIWPDTDNAGMIIAKNLKEIVPEAELVLVDYENKEILTVTNYSEWATALSSNLLSKDREQENFLGESSLWDNVFKK